MNATNFVMKNNPLLPTGAIPVKNQKTDRQYGAKKTGKVKINQSTGLVEELATGRTGQTYTGTVYINESQNMNNSNGFLGV